MRGIEPPPNPSDSLQVPVNWKDKPVWGCPTVAQLHSFSAATREHHGDIQSGCPHPGSS